MSEDPWAGFESFARVARPRLVRALAPMRGEDAADGAAEALANAWERGLARLRQHLEVHSSA